MTTTKLVTITIDGKQYSVPAGANLVDAAKWHADNDIPVFCYHPKMDPVGMCRMCVVELGMPMRDRATGELVMDGDAPKINWMPKLQTACTQVVADGMTIRTDTAKVKEGRQSVIEFLLTSHPLDCPVCDKGGECPLQNLTMAHGKGDTRMAFEDKQHLEKHFPLGELIYLDRERCIQCARCIRFQDELVGDDVLAFHERGRRLQIVTHSDPGFDTYFSGNTTDICPVGALTTADFRFGARPWELSEVPSICPHDAAGSNISLSTRLDRDFGGRAMVKRVMPRQNEYVNEIWISDRTRFVHHFTRSDARLQSPMLRRGNAFGPSVWTEVLPAVAQALKDANGDVAAIAGSGLSNEDLWELKQLLKGLGSERLGAWPPSHAGADLAAQVGVGQGTQLSKLGAGDAVLVIASDLEEEVPMWRYHAKRAQDRGAYLVVASHRHTRLADFAGEDLRRFKPMAGADLRYGVGEAASFLSNLKTSHPEVAEKLSKATNLIIIAGADGLDYAGSAALAQAAANFLIETGHVGKAQNGLLIPIPGPNGMGLHYMGYTPAATHDIIAKPPKVLIVAQAAIADDDPSANEWLDGVHTVIHLGLFFDKAAEHPHTAFALPIQSFAERDGSFTNGERRVQRFYTAQGPIGDALPAWKVFAQLRERLALGRAKLSAAAVMLEIATSVPAFNGVRYKELGATERQYPDVGGGDQYYGGTAYQNKGGLGVQLASAAEQGSVSVAAIPAAAALKAEQGALLLLPTESLYNRSATVRASAMIHPRTPQAHAVFHPQDAKQHGLSEGDAVALDFGAGQVTLRAVVSEAAPQGAVLVPRHLADVTTPMQPTSATVQRVAAALAVQ